MSAKIQRFGRAAQIREALLGLPAGANEDQLLASGKLTCTPKELKSSLAAMVDTDQLRVSTATGDRVWSLTQTMQKLMREANTRATPSRSAAARVVRTTPNGDQYSTTIQHKDRERQALAQLLADFRKAGGEIEVLGTTPIRSSLTRRQVIESSGRNKADVATTQEHA